MNRLQPQRIIYVLVLVVLSGAVLAIFLRPTKHHSGLNGYYRATFPDMVSGTAHRPYVCRTLLPSTVRTASLIVPDSWHRACAEVVQAHVATKELFRIFEWDTPRAFQYLFASTLMFLCFVGFGHTVVQLVGRVCPFPQDGYAKVILVTATMLGLPALFRYTSYPYDPPQLLLFTLGLYLLSAGRMGMFVPVFIACCLNKETAVLLVGVYAMVRRGQETSRGRYWAILLILSMVYAGIKGGLTWIFRDNPGGFVEFHLAHNLRWLFGGWTLTDLTVMLVLGAAVGLCWGSKPAFLRISLVCTAVPLVGLAMFFGFVDEWRGYYEVYPIVVASVAHSVRCVQLACAAAGRPGLQEH